MNKKINFLILLLSILGLSTISAQTTISGTVTDKETKEALIGVNLIVKGTGIGTTTDIDGYYSLEIPKGALVLQASYTGYNPKNIKLEGRQTTIDIKLQPGKLLDEVVVIGYGSVKKDDVTGAVESLKPTDEEAAQFDNFQNLLQGRASGVYVQSNSNEIGAPNSVRIRGVNSLRGDNEPLYVVDGIIISSATEDARDPLQGGSSYLSAQNGLTGINSQDIESIEVLKDASATAIYGSRGANGVIIITTKKGGGRKRKEDGSATFKYQLTTKVGQATRLIDVLDSKEYVNYQNDWRAQNEWDPLYYNYADGSMAEYEESPEFMEAKSDSIPRLQSVDWFDDIFQQSFSQNHRLSISGGKKKSNYYLAAGYGNSRGIVPGSSAKNGDFLFNFNQKLSDRLEISPRISGSFVRNDASKGTENLGSSNGSLIRQMIIGAPLLGTTKLVLEDTNIEYRGPRVWLDDYDDVSNEFRGLASLKLDYKISKVFTYRFLAGGDYRNKKRQIWFGNTIARGRLSNGEAGITQFNRIRYNIDNTLLFKKNINPNNRINGTVGVVLDETSVEQTSFTASNFANQDLRFDGISLGQAFQPLFLDKTKESLLSFLGRVNYELNKKYLFTVSFRGDGTSKFADGNKFSFFPSAAFAWKMTEEKFMQDQNLFSEAKLRIGWGRTGSQAIKPYQTLSRFGPTANLVSDGQGGQVSAIVPLNLANPNLIWETTEQVNVGFDYGIKNDRFSGNIDVYYKKTSDLLQQLSIGPSAGFSTFVTNQGDLTNRGIELGLTAYLLEGPLTWKINGNISFNRNKITNLGLPPTVFGTETFSAFLGANVSGGSAFKVPANIFIEGRPVGVFWGYETNGIIQDESLLENAPSVQGIASQLGDVLYIDRDGDGNINENDLTILGDPNPDFTYGLGSDFTYKNFNLSLFFNGVHGNDIANGNLVREDYALTNANNIRSQAYYGAWTPENTNATHPRLGYQLQGDFTDRILEDGSFLRLTYVTLGYTIPTDKIEKVQSANIFISGQNLLLFTNYSGFDPEVNSFSFDASRQGVDWGSFPNQKSILFGLNISF